jgi:hypothetical protein
MSELNLPVKNELNLSVNQFKINCDRKRKCLWCTNLICDMNVVPEILCGSCLKILEKKSNGKNSYYLCYKHPFYVGISDKNYCEMCAGTPPIYCGKHPDYVEEVYSCCSKCVIEIMNMNINN